MADMMMSQYYQLNPGPVQPLPDEPCSMVGWISDEPYERHDVARSTGTNAADQPLSAQSRCATRAQCAVFTSRCTR